MPYTLDNLPDNVKALPKEAKEDWLKIFNNAYEQYKDDGKAMATAWAALKENAGWEKDKEGNWIKKIDGNPNNTSRFGGQEVVNEILDRDGHKCIICGSNRDLTIHHKDGNGRYTKEPNNDKENLITLCRSCHGILDKEGISVTQLKERVKKSSETEDEIEIFVPVSKLDDTQNLVFGWGSVVKKGGQPFVDSQGDIIEDMELEKAIYNFMSAPLHDEQHQRIVHDSTIVESFVVTDDKLRKMFPEGPIPQGNRGWWIGIRIKDPEVYRKHKEGIYTGFSITGTAQRVEV